MTKIVRIGASGNKVEWKDALKEIQPDDMLLLEPGYYKLEPGMNVTDITIKGTGANPEDTIIDGYFILNSNCSFFTLENVCIETPTDNNSLFVDSSADTYLTLRNVIIHGNTNDNAAIAINGKCTLELFSVTVLGASISMFESADFRITMTNTLLDYPSPNYSALGIQGKGTVIISNSIIKGSISTYQKSNCELDVDKSEINLCLIHGSTWMNILNSKIKNSDDASFYISDESWVNIIDCQINGGMFLDKKTRTIIQNTKINRLISCNDSKLTLNNCVISSHADFQDNSSCDASRTAFSGSKEFEFFLALNKNAKLIGSNIIINANDSILAVNDQAKVKLNILPTNNKELKIKYDNKSNIDIVGVQWSSIHDN